MNIAVDAGCLGVKDKRLKVGVYNFAKNLLLELSKIDTENKYYLYSFYPIDESLMKRLGPNMRNVIVRPMKGWLKIWLPIRMVRDRVNLFLALGQSAPPRMSPNIRTIGFVYDLAFEKYPFAYPGDYQKLHSNTAELVKKSNIIISISEKTREDVIKYFKIASNKVIAIPLGVRRFPQGKEVKKIKRNPYFLYVGSLKRIKNIPALIKAFDLFLSKTKHDTELLLIGGDKWIDPEIDSVLSTLSEESIEKITFIGYAGDDELVDLYRNAIAFVSPSLYEGFGLTFVEAMALECPVIASNGGSLPEVVGKAGIIVEPTDVEALAQAMNDLHKNNDLRIKLTKKGKSKVSDYTWERCANSVYGVIQQFK